MKSIWVLLALILIAIAPISFGATTIIRDTTSNFNGINNSGTIKSDYYIATGLNAVSCDVKAYTNGSLYCGTDSGTAYTADEGNLTLVGSVFHLLKINLAEMDNSVSQFITNTVSNLVNYYTKTEIDISLNALPNITMQQVNNSNGNFSQFLSTYPNLDTDSTNDLTTSTTWGGNLTGTGTSPVIKPCGDTQILKYSSGDGWICAADNTGAGAESPFTDVDNIYLYNNSGTITLNETKLNNTIDTRDSDTIYDDTSVRQSIVNNITNHETTYKHGNTTAEIRNQFSGGNNISIINGVISVNMSITSGGTTSLDGLDIVNKSMLDNDTIVRSQNTSWFNVQYNARTDRYSITNFTTDYYAINNRYGIANFTANYATMSPYNINNFSSDYYTQTDRFTTTNASLLCSNSTNITCYFDGTTFVFGYNGSTGTGTATSLDGLDIVNQSMLDNNTIIRNTNTSWITANQNNYDDTSVRASIPNNITNHQNTYKHGNTTAEIQGVKVNNATWADNASGVSCSSIGGAVSNLCTLTDTTSSFEPSTINYVNHTQLQNYSIVRSWNTSWITSNQNYFNPSIIDYVNHTQLQNETIIRNTNTSWITTNQIQPINNCSVEGSCSLITYDTELASYQTIANTGTNITTVNNRINAVNTSANIKILGFNITTELKTYFDTLYTAAAGLFDNTNFSTQYYGITSRFSNTNYSALNPSPYTNINFTNQYYALTDRYNSSNFTSNYDARTDRWSATNDTVALTNYQTRADTATNLTGYQTKLINSSNITCIGNQCYYNGSTGGVTYTFGANISGAGNVISINASLYSTSSFNTDYYALTNRYSPINFTAQINALTNISYDAEVNTWISTNITDLNASTKLWVYNGTLTNNASLSTYLSPYLKNNTGQINVSVISIFNSTYGTMGIWNNGSGICIGAC